MSKSSAQVENLLHINSNMFVTDFNVHSKISNKNSSTHKTIVYIHITNELKGYIALPTFTLKRNILYVYKIHLSHLFYVPLVPRPR